MSAPTPELPPSTSTISTATFSGLFAIPLQVGDILEVVEVNNPYTAVLRLVSVRAQPAAERPPDIGVSVSEAVGTQERLG
jgi:hypothetical protein